MSARRGRKLVRRRNAAPYWASLPDAELLQVPLADIRVPFKGSWTDACLGKLKSELGGHGLLIQPNGWFSDEWFSPHESPGIAFPFYLAHPRLARLERKMILEVEGGTQRECMRLLRHEAGHVVQRAYGLHRRSKWRALFGQSARPYPDYYRPNPESRNYVQYLRRWYAQCHPDEDFAETFAVWLSPRSNWRKRYADWPALKKLLYVDELMQELDGARPTLVRRVEIDAIHRQRGTLGDHYAAKLDRYAVDTPSIFDRDLKRIFTPASGGVAAATFVAKNRAAIRGAVARWTGEYPVAIDAAFDDMIHRCRALKLRAHGAERKSRLDLTALLATKAVRSLYSATRRQSFAV